MKVLIIGAGLAGLSTAYYLDRLGLDYTILEKEDHVGGLCSTFRTDNGFKFDKAMHILHLRDLRLKRLVEGLLNEGLLRHSRNAWIRFRGLYVKYPFQTYFFTLPFKEIVEECFLGLREAGYGDKSKNYVEYVIDRFGIGIAKHFFIPYGKKLWATSLKNLSADWPRRFIPKAHLNGVLQAKRGNVPPPSMFYYPEDGGIGKVSEGFLNRLRKNRVYLNRNVIEIDLKRKKATLANGETHFFDHLVSTIPLPELLNILVNVPLKIKNLALDMRFNSLYNVNIGVDEKIEKPLSSMQTIYFPNEDVIFYRVGFPSTLSPKMAPKDCRSLSIDISYLSDRSPNKKEIKEKVIKDLIRTGLLKRRESIMAEKIFDIQYSYVLYDMNYTSIKETSHAFLRKNGVYSIGRYGTWEYSNMDDAIIDGQNAANSIYSSTQRI